jgi:RsiW-degrading membrane proteinase PrsW (M82 family)
MTSRDLPAHGTGQSAPAIVGPPLGAVRRWAWLITLGVGLLLYEAVRRTVATTHNPKLVPTLLVLGAAVAPASFLAFIRGRPLRYQVSGLLVAITALVGGVVGVVLAATWEYDTLRRMGTLSMAAVGLAEETAKLVVPALVLVFVGYRTPANGLLLGVASGAGFAALETMGFAFVALIGSRGDLDALDGLFLLRGLLSPAAHMAWTGLTAAALWSAAAHRWRFAAVVRFIAVFLVAVALHATWDSLRSATGYLVIGALGLGLLVATAHARGRTDAAAAGAG